MFSLYKYLEPVVQNFVSLTTSETTSETLTTQQVNADYISKYTAFLLIKCENPLHFHILSTKNNNVFVIVMFEILTNRLLTMSLI